MSVKNWCPIFYSAEARRTLSEFIGDSRVARNHVPSSPQVQDSLDAFH
jgi:hypothetical protein